MVVEVKLGVRSRKEPSSQFVPISRRVMRYPVRALPPLSGTVQERSASVASAPGTAVSTGAAGGSAGTMLVNVTQALWRSAFVFWFRAVVRTLTS